MFPSPTDISQKDMPRSGDEKSACVCGNGGGGGAGNAVDDVAADGGGGGGGCGAMVAVAV